MNVMVDFEQVAETARRLKLERVSQFGASPDEGECDLMPVALVVRDGEQVAQLWSSGHPESRRIIAYYACLGFDAETVYLVSDSRMRHVPVDAARDWFGGRRDGITECLVIIRFGRDGTAQQRIYPYERDGTSMHWKPPSRDEENADVDGAIPDHAKEGFARSVKMREEIGPTLEATADALGIDEAEGKWRIDRAFARFASTMNHVGVTVVWGGPDDKPSVFDNGQEVE